MSRFCTKCGAALNETDPFCGRCGSQLQEMLTQPAVATGRLQAARQPLVASSFPQENRTAPQTAPAPLQTNPSLPSISRSRLQVLLIVAIRVICIAVGLDIFCMFCSLVQDVDNNLFYNKWDSLDTPQQLHNDAMSAGGLGLLWGILLGSVGSWIKVVIDKRRAKQ